MVSSPYERQGSFVPAPIPENEAERVAALRALDVLDSAEEEIYNTIVKAAAEICETSMASLTFVDSDRQWFKSKVGLEASATSRDVSFCGHAILGSELFVVEDALKDARFRGNPLVQGAPNIRFYAGMPLLTESGLALGTLCVIDKTPRSLSPQQRAALGVLANSVMRVLKLRQDIRVAVFARAVDMASDGVTISSAAAGELTIMYANESFLELTGYAYVEVVNRPAVFPVETICQQATDAVLYAETKGKTSTVECQFRRKDGATRWARVTFVPYVDAKGRLVYLVAVHRDITAVREAEMQTQQLYAMRTTMATIAHVVNNFLNSAALYSSMVDTKVQIDPVMQQAFTCALEDTRSKLTAINRMSSFKDRPTPFGFSLLDVEDNT
ncbi:MAG: GAF domain-containing protein [Bryobacteraceae bacterium]